MYNILYNYKYLKKICYCKFLRHWFGEDGEPIRLPDPLTSPFCCKLLDTSDNNEFLDIKYINVSKILQLQ